MLLELENKDIDRIAKKVRDEVKEALRYFIENNRCDTEEIFDVEGLARYLKVNRSWIYEKTHRNDLPYYKIGRFLRFRKKEIDRWLDSQKRLAAPSGSLPSRMRSITK
jgi:excisionase family DNA binding protein